MHLALSDADALSDKYLSIPLKRQDQRGVILILSISLESKKIH